jgi:hypothetical protein
MNDTDARRENREIGFVLGRLGINPNSPIGDLLTPGIRGGIAKNGVSHTVEWFKEYSEKVKREKPEMCVPND